MNRAIEIPTDQEISEAIDDTERFLQYLKSLQKLNEAGREQALIYMFGLTHLKKYRKDSCTRNGKDTKGVIR